MTTAQAMPRGGCLDQARLHHVTDLQTLDAFRRWAGERRDILCADTESGGLAWHKDRHRKSQLGDKYDGWAFPPGWMGAAHEILTSYTGRVGFWNATYDRLVLGHQSGVHVPLAQVEDAMTAAWLADSKAALSLKPRCAADIDPSALALDRELSEAMRANRWTWDTVPDDHPAYWQYGAMDPVQTAWLLDKHLPAARSQFASAYDSELSYADLCAQMMTAGMMIDRPFIEDSVRQVTAYRDRALAWLAAQGVTSIRSNEPVGDALRRAGVEIDLFTGQGKPQIDKAAMIHYRAQHPEAGELIDAIQHAKKADDLISKTLGKFLAMADGDDLIHCSIHPLGAQRTGRSSVREPSMQNLDTDVPMVRGSFRPPPGWVIVTCDADQIEMRLAAHFSRDRRLIADIAECDATGQSFFVNLAGRIYGEPVAKSDRRYKTTKNTAYGTIYGSGQETAAATAGVSLAEIEPVYKAWKEMYRGLSKMMREITDSCEYARGRPHVTTPFGNELTVDRGRAYSGTDYLVQGTAAQIMKRGGVELRNRGLGDYLRLSVHDEWVAMCPREYGQDVLRVMTETLTDTQNWALPITWSGTVIDGNWRKT